MSAGSALLIRSWALQSVQAQDGWAPVAQLDELTEGRLHLVHVGGHPVVLLRAGDDVFAVDERCPHRGGPMSEGVVEGFVIRCPWHGFRFDVRSGAVVWPDGWEDLQTYATRVQEGRIQVAVTFESSR